MTNDGDRADAKNTYFQNPPNFLEKETDVSGTAYQGREEKNRVYYDDDKGPSKAREVGARNLPPGNSLRNRCDVGNEDGYECDYYYNCCD